MLPMPSMSPDLPSRLRRTYCSSELGAPYPPFRPFLIPSALFHISNLYASAAPDFAELAAQFESFAPHVRTDALGRAHVDFKVTGD